MAEIIGKGGYGTVYKVIQNGCFIAVKETNLSKMKGGALEMSIMSSYCHPSINNCKKISISADHIVMMYQEMAECDLKNYILKTGKIPIEKCKIWAKNICKGLSFLEKESISHGDIKPHNILVYKNNSVKITDFGCSVILRSNNIKYYCGTLKYNSPEMLEKGILSHYSDVWSYGCLIYEMLTSRCLLDCPSIKTAGMNKNEIEEIKLLRKTNIIKSIKAWCLLNGDPVDNIGKNSKAFPIAFNLNSENEFFVKKMLKYIPEERPLFSALEKDPWFGENNERLSAQVICEVLHEKDMEASYGVIKKYLRERKLNFPSDIINQITQIYGISNSTSREDLEACIEIVFGLFRYRNENFHITCNESKIKLSKAKIYSSTNFRIHKISYSDLYMKMGR
jgi:serine/threonine protein kinase